MEPRISAGISKFLLNMEDNTFKVLFDIYKRVMEIFPFEYIHIGGDEARKQD